MITFVPNAKKDLDQLQEHYLENAADAPIIAMTAPQASQHAKNAMPVLEKMNLANVQDAQIIV